MIAVDTNVLVRFLVEDDPEQMERAKNLLRKAVESDTPCYVSDVVLCELVWVLERTYKIKRPEIGSTLSRLLRARHLAFFSADRLSRALEAYGSGPSGFADYLIREHARDMGCTAVATFDGDLLAQPDFMPVLVFPLALFGDRIPGPSHTGRPRPERSRRAARARWLPPKGAQA